MLQREPVNREGVITSPVYAFAGTGTMITRFSWNHELPRDTFVWFEIRLSDGLFAPDDTRPGWYRITNNQHGIYLHREGEDYLRGKYYQWRAHLIPSPEGNRAPSVSGIRLDYELDNPPDRPQLLEVVSTGSERVTLRWKMNVDHDFHSYRLYYGIRSGEYEGVLTHINGRTLGNHLAKDARIELTVDNDLIEQNRALDRSGMRDYPLLKNNVLYYFAVSACDSYRPGTPFNHESPRSTEVAGRPFGGSEIRPAR
jgi:hypothetical protein